MAPGFPAHEDLAIELSGVNAGGISGRHERVPLP